MIDSEDILGDPIWLPHSYDAGNRRVAFARIPPETRQELTFLADFRPSTNSEICWVDQAVVEESSEVAEPDAQLHFLFHSAFCRSTLLVRALGTLPGVAGLSEPAILNGLQAASSDSVARRLIGPICALLGRPMAGERTVVVKPSNFPNAMIPVLLDQSPGAKAVLLYGGLPEFLRSVAKKGLAGRIWARRQLAHNRLTMPLELGMDERAHYELTDLQCAALAWLLQMRQFAMLLADRPDTLRSLETDCFIAHKAQALSAAAAHFDIELSERDALAVTEGPLFASHAKLGGDYAAIQAEQSEAAESHVTEEEIEQIGRWIDVIIQQLGLTLPLPNSLKLKGD